MSTNKNPLDLPVESLASLDAEGRRLFVYTAKVWGEFAKRRRLVHFILMLIFLILPWIKIAGHQAILLDLPQRQFAFFGLVFWAHDAPIVFFVLAILAFSLIAATALWGRAWCGWACPQTVFIESIFRWIETKTEGDHIARRRLDESPASWRKAKIKIVKWALYTLSSLVITHSFLAYFVGSTDLLTMVRGDPRQNWISFVFIVFTTGLVLFNFGWFREQFCLIVCPYGRFQSVLMDEHSLSVGYDTQRGEPRRGVAQSKESQGDCVNCYKCVAVCPTAIDIRRGLQMECIACTACIDACNDVMQKIGKPPGLIRYSTEAEFKNKPHKRWRPRVLIYVGLLFLAVIGLTISVSRRQDVHFSIQRAIEVPYKEVTLPNGAPKIINHFKIHLKNHKFENVKVFLQQDFKEEEFALIFPQNGVELKPGEDFKAHFFVQFTAEWTRELGQKRVPIQVLMQSKMGERSSLYELTLVGPK